MSLQLTTVVKFISTLWESRLADEQGCSWAVTRCWLRTRHRRLPVLSCPQGVHLGVFFWGQNASNLE
jgi:hypothetical protein